ncbi:MAG: aromatic hydrocarbon degradation protein [Desulfobulbus propionicus]|nr:MAG: aromatic hydrocarbon degradation protein [Desulfobulbus propionicus]
MKKLYVSAIVVLAGYGVADASGWRIPEQSMNSVARSGGYVAYTPAADAAYYNPANMSWLEDRGALEIDATWIRLSSITYEDNRSSLYDGTSEEEDFFLPTFFAVSPYYGNFRFGFSLTAPGGLSKQWQDPFPRTTAEEFSLKIFEANPSVSYSFCDHFSLGIGARAVYTDGKVKSNGTLSSGYTLSRDMEGDALDAGYNLALTTRPLDNLSLAATYRSKVDLNVSGSAELATSAAGSTYSGDSDVTIPLPAVLSFAAAYTFFDNLTVELEYERTYWSEYEYLDFNYPVSLINPILTAAFDAPLYRNWSDTDTYRISMEYVFTNGLVLMAGFAIDENPAPEETVSFELPDSDARLYSIGFRYPVSEDMEIGIAYLYDGKEDRDVEHTTINGSFSDAAAHLVTIGFSLKL